MVEAVAKSPATTVLIEGESGTGKQIVARRIHDRSAELQAAKGGESHPPFVELNAAALPEPLVESSRGIQALVGPRARVAFCHRQREAGRP